MFWLIVFLGLAGVLAYRAAPLPTATGLIGVTVLLYGWLGESSGRFVLLALLYLLLFVPLNVPALRQEWISRPLLDRLLARPLPTLSPHDAGPAAGLLDGRWDLRLPAAPAPTPADTELRLEALGAALAQRLSQPSRPLIPQPEQAEVAALLYGAAALDHHDPRLLGDGLDCSGEHLRAVQAWPLAQAACALRGRAPEASLDWTAAAGADIAGLGERCAQAHGPSVALWSAVREESPAQRLIRFDEAFWRFVGHGLSQLTRSVIGGLSQGLLIPAPGEDQQRRDRQRASLACSRIAALADLRLALVLADRLPPGFDSAYARAYLRLAGLHAALAWHEAARSPYHERPLLRVLSREQHRLLEEQLSCALRSLPQVLLRGVLRWLILPPGSGTIQPGGAENQAAALALLREPTVRARLISRLPAHPGLQALEQRMQVLQPLESSLRRLQLAQIEPTPSDETVRVTSAERLGLLSEAEAGILREALDFANTQLNPDRS